MSDRSFTVIVDTKEKQPWSLSSSAIQDVKYQHLKTGDYTVEGLEDILCIERKASANELCQNLFQKRFQKELVRMKEFPERFLLLESSMEKVINYPRYEDLPPIVLRKIKVSGAYFLKCLNRIQIEYGINIIYCCNKTNAAWVATNLMSEVVRKYGLKDND